MAQVESLVGLVDQLECPEEEVREGCPVVLVECLAVLVEFLVDLGVVECLDQEGCLEALVVECPVALEVCLVVALVGCLVVAQEDLATLLTTLTWAQSTLALTICPHM